MGQIGTGTEFVLQGWVCQRGCAGNGIGRLRAKRDIIEKEYPLFQEKIIEPKYTKRAVIDVGKFCPMSCRFCYFHHLGDLTKQKYGDFNYLKNEIDRAIGRGNSYLDYTGGSPTSYPRITELIKYALKKNIKSCLITEAIAGKARVNEILESGVDDFLVSLHGLNDVADFLFDYPGAFKKQVGFIEQISGIMRFRFNFVINRFNQDQILETAKFMQRWNPLVINMINMNPHYDWRFDTAKKDIIANLREVQPQLEEVIPFLEENGIGFNLRYYPFCRLDKKYWKNICNPPQVLSDPYEWDYDLQPIIPEKAEKWIRAEFDNIANKGEPCRRCNLLRICGGANKYHHEASFDAGFGEIYEAKYPDDIISDAETFDYMRYRKYNTACLGER